MRTNNFLIITMTMLLALGLTTACRTDTTANKTVANQPANKAAINADQTEAKTATNDNQPKIVETETNKTSVGSLATPTEAYKTAYAARQKKDVKNLKRVLSKDILEFFAVMGESEQKSIDDELKNLTEQPQAATDESRNEKITGDHATIEYPDENGKWKTMDFVKEGNDWKMTVPAANSLVITDTSKKHK